MMKIKTKIANEFQLIGALLPNEDWQYNKQQNKLASASLRLMGWYLKGIKKTYILKQLKLIRLRVEQIAERQNLS